MKTFPAGFTAQKNTPAGAKPVWFLALPTAADGSGIVYISDRSVTVKNVAGVSVTTKAMVSSWGQIREGVTGQLGEYSVAEFRVHLLNDPTDPENIVHLIDNHDIETATTVLYSWFEGITDNAQPMFTGYVRDIVLDENDAGVELTLQDATLKSQRDVGIVATKALLGNSLDNNDVGKILPIVFGSVTKVPAIRAIVPIKTTITAALTETTTAIPVSDATGLVAGMYLNIDSERVYISSVSGQTLTCTRGQNSTAAAVHDKGSVAIEYKTSGFENFVFIAAGHALTSLSKVWSLIGGEFYDISALCNRYNYNGWTGQTWATVKMPNAITLQQLTALNLTGLIAAINSSHTHYINPAATGINQTLQTYPVSGNNNIVIPSGTYSYVEAVQVTASFPAAPGTITACSLTYTAGINLGSAAAWCVTLGNIVVDGWFSDSPSSVTRTTVITDATAMNENYLKIWYRALGNGSATTVACGTATISSASRSITYIASGSTSGSAASNVTLNNTLALTGTQIAATLYESGIYCDMTSTYNAPKYACDWLLANYGPPGITSVTSDNSIHTTAGNINGCIIEKKPLLYWLNRIAFEFRSRFKYIATGAAKLIYRPDTLTSAHTVTNAESRNFTRRRSEYDAVINKIDLRYARDWSNAAAEPYTALTSVTDSASIAKYGEKENASAFQFDFLTGATLVGTIAAYYLAYFKSRHWIYELEAFLDNMELEYADIITVGAVSSNPVGVITEASLSPGSDTEPDTIKLIIET